MFSSQRNHVASNSYGGGGAAGAGGRRDSKQEEGSQLAPKAQSPNRANRHKPTPCSCQRQPHCSPSDSFPSLIPTRTPRADVPQDGLPSTTSLN